ncbi:RNA polymerase sigma-54 factor RpoN [Enhygromyxa salina]|uniref:RNA polymerase sigma factor n=1 Tax=Enhygromyxa salina TaxID=215803 RepID=A0A0C2D882_9BACT|nr:sigma-70 family RNA polymerase sigma factor [Enhygromyxa salina]KIG17835.1 RNA polymerase sigma-54 factor RpoN [Enhygromyxa salina]
MSTEAASSASGANGPSLDSEEREIIEGMRAGDDRAFERLVRAHVGPLRAVALRLLKNDADADDIVQEAFLSAFRNFDSFRADSRLQTWLHRIVVNGALQRLRRAKHRAGQQGDGELVDVSELLPRFAANGHPEHFSQPWVQTIEELATRAETREQVRQMIDKLPDNYRTVLILRDIEELDTSETAELLELTPGTVKVRLHRARQALRNLLERELELTANA